MILVLWKLSFKPDFSLSSFTFIKRIFTFFLLSAIRVVLSAYLSLLILLSAVLIPACDSSSLAFHMMYFVYRLNKQGDNIYPCCNPFKILNQLFELGYPAFQADSLLTYLIFCSNNMITTCFRSKSFSSEAIQLTLIAQSAEEF